MVKKLILLSVCVLVSAVLLQGCAKADGDLLKSKQLTSERQLTSLIETNNSKYFSGSKGSGWSEGIANDSASAAPGAGSSGNDFSKTNVQTEGADEGDIVKVDSEYIYVLNQNGFHIVSAGNGALSVTSSVSIENYVPQEMFIINDKLIIIGGIYETLYWGSGWALPLVDCWAYMSYTKTDIRFYDISDRSEPVLERNITLSGNYYTSRIIDGKLYYVVNYYFYYEDTNNYLPRISDTADGGLEKKMPLKNIFYYEDIQSYNYIIFGSVEIENTEKSVLKAYLGLYGDLYFSLDNIYVAAWDNSDNYRRSFFGRWVWSYKPPKTKLYRIALDDLMQKASARIEGTIKDRYSLDEYKGYLRVVTTTDDWNSGPYTNVFVLDMKLKTVGEITDIAPGERVFAVKFNGDEASIVTFVQTDPLFKVNLANPKKPTISEGLEKDGVSQYLHFLPNGMLLGVGRDTAVDPQFGFVRWKGLEVCLFDNSGEDAVPVATYILGDDAYSELFWNPKALMYNEERGLIAFPVQYWDYVLDENGWYRYGRIKQGLEVFKYDAQKGELIHLTAGGALLTNIDEVSTEFWQNYYDSYLKFITRGVQIGDYIYTISSKMICSYAIAEILPGKATTKFDSIEF